MIKKTIALLTLLAIATGAGTDVKTPSECRACADAGNELCAWPVIGSRSVSKRCCPPGDITLDCFFCSAGTFANKVQTCPSASFCGKTTHNMYDGDSAVLGNKGTTINDFCVYTLKPLKKRYFSSGEFILTAGNLKVDVKVQRQTTKSGLVEVPFKANQKNIYEIDDDEDLWLIVTLYK